MKLRVLFLGVNYGARYLIYCEHISSDQDTSYLDLVSRLETWERQGVSDVKHSYYRRTMWDTGRLGGSCVTNRLGTWTSEEWRGIFMAP